MTDAYSLPKSPNVDSRVNQELIGNNNQVVGPVSGGIIVNVSGHGGQVTISPQKDSEEQTESKPSPKKVPRLLPYLPNRKKQEDELEKAIQNHLNQASPKPMICILHGDQDQCHKEFLDRLIEYSFFEQVGLHSSDEKIWRQQLFWPHDLERNKMEKIENLEYWLLKDLAEKILNRRSATKEVINQVFCKYPSPVLIETRLSTKNWQRQGDLILDKLLCFWQTWPALNHGTKIIICLSIEYEITRKNGCQKSRLKRFWDYLINYFKNKDSQSKNKEIQTKLKRLSEKDFQRFSCLSGIVLPELTGVYQGQVKDWASSDEVKRVIGEEMIGDLIAPIEGFFQNQQSDTIPMRPLAQQLRELLKRFTVNHN